MRSNCGSQVHYRGRTARLAAQFRDLRQSCEVRSTKIAEARQGVRGRSCAKSSQHHVHPAKSSTNLAPTRRPGYIFAVSLFHPILSCSHSYHIMYEDRSLRIWIKNRPVGASDRSVNDFNNFSRHYRHELCPVLKTTPRLTTGPKEEPTSDS